MATKRDPRVQVAPAYANAKRSTRSPRYPFFIEQRPFQLQPFMICPVVPGDTMSNAVLQSRVYSDPVKSAHIGWWCEQWLFYVKHRDLAARDDFAAMMLDPTKDMSSHFAPADPKFYHAGGIPWLKLCYQRIVEEYFRDEGENWDNVTLDGLSLTQVSGNNVFDSLTLDAEKQERDVDLDLDGDGKIEASEANLAMRQWEAMREAGLMPMDYEDFIRSYGVQVRQEEESVNLHRPEVLRHVRQWTYPTNTIDPSDGTPRSALSWSIAEGADKARFFSEPGFVVGLSAVRPKVYFNKQIGSFVGALNNAIRWLPAVLHDNYELSYMQISEGQGPVPTLEDDGGYWVDTRDLFVHGEQFTNVPVAGLANGVALPSAAGATRYAAPTDIDGFFVDPAKNKIHMDGVCTLSIRGRQKDNTPRGVAL